MEKQIKVLIVGTGNIAGRHATHLKRIEDVSIAGVCDVDRARAEAFSAKHCPSAARFSNFAEALERVRPAYVVLCTPREVRENIIAECIAHMTPILMEKPPCHDVATGERISRMLTEAGLLHAVGFMHRWHDALNDTLNRLEGQMLTSVGIRFLSPMGLNPPVAGAISLPYLVERSGGLVGDQGIHYVDIARYLCRSEVARIASACGCCRLLKRTPEITSCDTASWILRMEDGVLVTHRHTWCAPCWSAKIEIVTTRSVVEVDLFGDRAAGTIEGKAFEYSSRVPEFEAEHRGFIAALRANDQRSVRSSYADALRSFMVAEDLNKLIYK